MEENAAIHEIESALDGVLARDAHWCRARLQAWRRRRDRAGAVDMLQQIRARVQRSAQSVAERRQRLPLPTFDPALPITAHREQIVQALRDRPVLIVAGETGSGKTTQLPKFCLQAGRGLRGQIGCTQPRRIAASAMAQRVAEELGGELGAAVGYQVRFRDRSSPDGFIRFMTDGILLAAIAADPDLLAYDTLIIDEAHERSLNVDFLLGYLKLLLARRPDLRLVISSATIDTEKFSRHFGGAPVIEVSGRGHPVDIVYQPLEGEAADGTAGDRDLHRAIATAVRRVERLDPHGDILVFLSGEREIREAGDFLGRQRFAHTEILPLYARLSLHEQRRVFHPGPARRIILCTNVAETSLTVPRIRFVIDSGLARISRFAHRSGIQRLPIEPVSQASASQRAGRCGRIGPGTCVRLYGEADLLSRPAFTEPEILRTLLGSVMLRLAIMGLGELSDFPFIDPPAPRMIAEAHGLLVELGAIDRQRRPTALGRRLDRWPLDLRLARMVCEGAAQDCLEETLVIASALSIQDPRERPADLRQAADEAHARFVDSKSDFTALLNLWGWLRQQRRALSASGFRQLCRREFLNTHRVLEWFDLHQQLRDQAREDGLPLSGKPAEPDRVHRALLSGLLGHVGRKHPEDDSYLGARSRSFRIFPGSGLAGRAPKWIMSAEVVETERAWGRVNAAIRPQWIEQQAAHLLKRQYSDPHWSRQRGCVMAWEQVSLYGLVIVERRHVSYGRIDAAEARKIFILEALVRGELDTQAEFMVHNLRLREEVERLEHKRRRHDVLADEGRLYDFFDARVPQDVLDARSLQRWLEQPEAAAGGLLRLEPAVLLAEDAGKAPEELFPDTLAAGGCLLPLDYHFEPGHPADGVSVRVPLELLNALQPECLQWLVPGLLREKLVALIRALPKPLRRSLAPVPAFADALLEALGEPAGRSLPEACAAELSRMSGLALAARDFDESAIAGHLRFRIVVTDEAGEVLAESRDLAGLQQRFGRQAQRRFMDRQGAGFNRDGLQHWDLGELPAEVLTAGGLKAWPALVDQQDSVGVRLFDVPGEAAAAHAEGVLRLLALNLAGRLADLRRHPGLTRASLAAWLGSGLAAALLDDLLRAALQQAAGEVDAVRDAPAFERALERARAGLGAACAELARVLNEVLPAWQDIRLRLARGLARRSPDSAADIAEQLADLFYPGFLAELEPGRLAHYPRYLAALVERLRLMDENPARDRERLQRLRPWWQRYRQYLAAGGGYDEAVDAFRWLLHEYRVSVFAQRLGTAQRVSEQRLEAAWKEVQQSQAAIS